MEVSEESGEEKRNKRDLYWLGEYQRETDGVSVVSVSAYYREMEGIAGWLIPREGATDRRDASRERRSGWSNGLNGNYTKGRRGTARNRR